MMHIHGARAQVLSARTGGVPLEQLVAVPVDVGKSTAMAMACDFTGQMLVAPTGFALNRDGVAEIVARVDAALPPRVRLVRVGVEAAGHYHRPLTASGVWPTGWQVVELAPAQVTEQRRTNDKCRPSPISLAWPSGISLLRRAGVCVQVVCGASFVRGWRSRWRSSRSIVAANRPRSLATVTVRGPRRRVTVQPAPLWLLSSWSRSTVIAGRGVAEGRQVALQ